MHWNTLSLAKNLIQKLLSNCGPSKKWGIFFVHKKKIFFSHEKKVFFWCFFWCDKKIFF